MQSTKNNLFRIPKLGKLLLLTSGLLLIGSGILLGNYAVKALNGGGNSPQNGDITFEGIKSQNLTKNFSKTHFTLKGNDFGGGFIWLPAKELEKNDTKTVQVGNETYTCLTQVRGFYYNSQRGERVWPLDDQTKGELWPIYNNLNLKGGRYTNCSSSSDTTATDPYGIYGSITHSDELRNTYVLNAGIKYNIGENRMESSNPAFQCNLQRLNNQFPFGYFFDNAGGIWLLWASVEEGKNPLNFHNSVFTELNKNKCLTELFTFDGSKVNGNGTDDLNFGAGTAAETIFKLGIRGVVGLSRQVQQEGKLGKDGNESWTSVLVRTDNSIANIFNLTKKNAEKLCKGKWKEESQVNQINQGNVICIDELQWENPANIDWNYLSNKTIIIKKGNLKLNSFMSANDNNTTIYLMNGDLILPEAVANTGTLPEFKGNGYLGSSSEQDPPSKAAYLKGNFIINGLLQIENNKTFKNKLVVHGKIASLNTLEVPNSTQATFLKKYIDANKKIILSELFDRECKTSLGEGSDGTPCWWEGFIVDKAFSLIDMNFPSPLFQ